MEPLSNRNLLSAWKMPHKRYSNTLLPLCMPKSINNCNHIKMDIENQKPGESTRLTYTKTILKKVSFDSQIFLKELKKSKYYLNQEEVQILKSWCRNYFTTSKSSFEHVLISL